jgi:hypothetical protein
MCLRHSPRLTPASLAARRANALKSTGPRTACGKARVALNPLKHGRRAVALREKLARAGYREGEALYRRIRSRLSKAFAIPGEEPDQDLNRQGDGLANWIWVFQRGLRRRQAKRAKLECYLESVSWTARLCQHTRIVTNCYTDSCFPEFPPALPATKICVRDSYQRVGIVFYNQQRRHFTGSREGRGFQPRRNANPYIFKNLSRGDRYGGAESPALPPLEDGLRCRVYRLARPRMWERLRFCLDKQGRYHREWEEEFRRVRAEWRGTDMAVWLEPHPILATLRQKERSGLR